MPNISVNFYGGELDVSYDCPGAIKCKHSLCEMMPPEDDEACTYRHYGSCICPAAQIAALTSVIRRLNVFKKAISDTLES